MRNLGEMNKQEIFRVLDELRKANVEGDLIIRDRIINYMEANIDEFQECYESYYAE